MSSSLTPAVASQVEEFFRAASLNDLKTERMLVVSGADRPVLLCWSEGRPFALDNRCPHMGFPLSKGTLESGVLTCHWHHAQFDLQSGCTFDLFADDVPAFEVRIEGDDVFVSKRPKDRIDVGYHSRRLFWGLEQNVGLIQAKGIIALLTEGERANSVIRRIARFGARNHRVWEDGLTTVSIVARLAPHLSHTTLIYALAKGARRVAENCEGQPARHSAGGLNRERFEEERLSAWLSHWSRIRHDEGAERTLLAALDSQLPQTALNRIVFAAVQDRIYADGGHALDHSNKAFELLDAIGWDEASRILPLLVSHLTRSRSEEEGGAWRVPLDLIPLIREAEDQVRNQPRSAQKKDPPSPAGAGLRRDRLLPPLYNELLGTDPKAILELIVSALAEGVTPASIARELSMAAAARLAHFPESNDVDDWFGPVHTFSFCNALYQVLSRGEVNPEIERGLLHGAMSIYVDRFLNIPSAKLPDSAALESLPSAAGALLSGILETLDQKKGWSAVANLVVRYLRLGHPESALIDTLTFATVREDLDFHKLQVLEAAVTQAELWPLDSPERELLYVGASRHLAAYCPTRRSSSQSVGVALRLHRGEAIHLEGEK
ncbi:MAG: Rieske 2Fe-2S domain-containing protein [Verrucomicrobia bacterium]|nr:Rieske 2Fe-2S domain-containing protein [Verrucomicrobiota bacterium]